METSRQFPVNRPYRCLRADLDTRTKRIRTLMQIARLHNMAIQLFIDRAARRIYNQPSRGRSRDEKAHMLRPALDNH